MHDFFCKLPPLWFSLPAAILLILSFVASVKHWLDKLQKSSEDQVRKEMLKYHNRQQDKKD